MTDYIILALATLQAAVEYIMEASHEYKKSNFSS